MKKHNGFKIVLISILVLLLLTWLLPAAVYQGSYVEQGRVQMGLFDLFSYPVATVAYFGYIAVFVLIVGGFYGVLSKTGVYRTLLDKIVGKFKGKEPWLLAIMMVLIAAVTSVCGANFALLAFFPLIISLVLLMGYNKLVAASVTVGSLMVGLMGTTFSGNTLDLLNQVLSLKIETELITKVIILVIGLVLLIFNTLWYAKKIKGAVNEEKEDFIPAKVRGKKKSVWPMIVVLDVVFLIIVLSFMPWSSAFGLDIFDKATEAVTGFEIGGFPIFGKILGTALPAFGSWSINEMMVTLLVATIVIGLIYRVKLDDFISSFFQGVKRALAPAGLMLLIYTCLVIVVYHPFQLVIFDFLLGLTKNFNVVLTAIVAFVASIFNVDMAYTVQNVVPYVTSIVTDTSLYPLVAIMFQTLYGFAMLFAPTSAILMGALAYLKVPYTDWLKYIWKLLLQLLVVLFIIFTIIMLV